MARKPMIAGNWKMYKTSGEGAILIQNVEPLVSDDDRAHHLGHVGDQSFLCSASTSRT